MANTTAWERPHGPCTRPRPSLRRMLRSEKWQHANVDVHRHHMGISPASVGIWQPSQTKCANRATTGRKKKSQGSRGHVDHSLIFPKANRSWEQSWETDDHRAYHPRPWRGAITEARRQSH